MNLIYNSARDQIQELVDDEDHSSIASTHRISQMMGEDNFSSRPSIYSMKGLELR